MSKRKRNLELSDQFRGQPCEVCNKDHDTVGDHIKTFGSGGECTLENLWSLCVPHHAEKHNLGLTTFVCKYPNLRTLLKIKGWAFDEFTKKWIRLTEDGWETDET